MPVYIEALEGVSDGVFYVGDMEHDHVAGSGSTIEAAAEMKVFSIGCEIDVKSYAAMITRMQVWKEKVSK